MLYPYKANYGKLVEMDEVGIEVENMISITEKDQNIIIAFPYNKEYIDKIRQVPGRKYIIITKGSNSIEEVPTRRKARQLAISWRKGRMASSRKIVTKSIQEGM